MAAIETISFETRLEVHLWVIDLRQPFAVRRTLFDELGADEKTRAEHYRSEKDRRSFIVRRGAAREILCRYLDSEPEGIYFSYNRFGKPALGAAIGDGLCFNTSCSQEIAVCAVTRGREIGVDVECVREEAGGWEPPRAFFTTSEAAELNALTGGARAAAFFRCWTRKEALIKAVGTGLSYAPRNFSVSAGTEKSVQVCLSAVSMNARCWALETFVPHPGYVGALAVEGSPPHVKFCRWSKI